MYKIFSSIFIMLFCVNLLFAKDIITMKLGKYNITGICVSSMNHDKNLFRYKNKDELKNFLAKQNSTTSAINVFLLEIDKHKILFDTGTNSKILLEKLNSININPKDIDVICITHMHYDHIAGLINDYNRTFPKANIYIAQEELNANKNSDLFLAYPNRIKPFKQNEIILSFIKTIPAFGHTAGHTMFEITSDGQTLLVCGDIIHAPIQFEEPNIYLTYDTDPIKALSVRKKIMKEYSNSGKYIAGAHLLNGGIGKIQKNKLGYKFEFIEK